MLLKWKIPVNDSFDIWQKLLKREFFSFLVSIQFIDKRYVLLYLSNQHKYFIEIINQIYRIMIPFLL